jgi:hypothetical protein
MIKFNLTNLEKHFLKDLAYCSKNLVHCSKTKIFVVLSLISHSFFNLTNQHINPKTKNASRTKPPENCPKVGFYLPKGIFLCVIWR